VRECVPVVIIRLHCRLLILVGHVEPIPWSHLQQACVCEQKATAATVPQTWHAAHLFTISHHLFTISHHLFTISYHLFTTSHHLLPSLYNLFTISHHLFTISDHLGHLHLMHQTVHRKQRQVRRPRRAQVFAQHLQQAQVCVLHPIHSLHTTPRIVSIAAAGPAYAISAQAISVICQSVGIRVVQGSPFLYTISIAGLAISIHYHH
jgi:hypothetical protein